MRSVLPAPQTYCKMPFHVAERNDIFHENLDLPIVVMATVVAIREHAPQHIIIKQIMGLVSIAQSSHHFIHSVVHLASITVLFLHKGFLPVLISSHINQFL